MTAPRKALALVAGALALFVALDVAAERHVFLGPSGAVASAEARAAADAVREAIAAYNLCLEAVYGGGGEAALDRLPATGAAREAVRRDLAFERDRGRVASLRLRAQGRADVRLSGPDAAHARVLERWTAGGVEAPERRYVYALERRDGRWLVASCDLGPEGRP